MQMIYVRGYYMHVADLHSEDASGDVPSAPEDKPSSGLGGVQSQQRGEWL